MKDKSWMVILGIIGIMFLVKFFPSANRMPAEDLASNDLSAEFVEIIHFHSTNQCYSCITLGELAEKTINEYYSENDKVIFRHINVDSQSNAEIVAQYKARGSALMIGTKIGDELNIEENILVWYKIGNEADFMGYLKSLIDKRLSGDLSQ